MDLIKSKGKDETDIWDSINDKKGSVQHLDFLNEEEKEVFRTYREINQLELVRQAAIRQEYIDQGQSINLAFFNDVKATWVNKVHLEAWKLGLKSLYYLRSQSKISGDSNVKDLYNECLMCEG
jgi:ribonucleoside-diphosphate reductase alpha chain